jgi:hypothetical protein
MPSDSYNPKLQFPIHLTESIVVLQAQHNHKSIIADVTTQKQGI